MYEMGSRLIEYRNRRADRMTPNQLEVNLGPRMCPQMPVNYIVN